MIVVDVYLCRSTRDFDRAYTYLPPDSTPLEDLEEGAVVEIPFGRGNTLREAWIWRIRKADERDNIKLKKIQTIKSKSLLRSDQFRLAKEMRRRYFCSISQALQVMAPPSIITSGEKTQRYTRLLDAEEAVLLLEEGSLRSLGQIRVLEFLLEVGEASLQEVMAGCQVSRAVLDGLRRKKLIENFNKEVEVAPPEMEVLEEAKEHQLNKEQELALSTIIKREEELPYSEFLLHGVTGSGKTEVYLRAADAVLKAGRDVIILVPEISLTPLICNRILNRFGKSAAILHSRLTPHERYEQWRSIRSGEKRLVAGARSAIFAPLKDIGLIVVDEEQESSYKSERTPRYQAADIARMRAAMHQAKLVLASATPSVVTYERSESGRSTRLVLSERAGAAVIPEVSIVDMRNEYAHDSKTIISRSLKAALAQSFSRGEQAMIFLNRRGHSSSLLCRECGFILKCKYCEVALTEHKNPRSGKQHKMICHYCGTIVDVPEVCPDCGSEHIDRFGVGTQQAEEHLQELFPERRFLRMDFDTTLGPSGHAKILSAFARHEADCLIGTQMIAKGHDFPKVTTVGILSADLLLAQHDYAAEERAFQLICQAAGRAGRHDLQGAVYIQSFNPQNPAVQAAAKQDYTAFYQEEIYRRKVLSYPPFSDIGLILCTAFQENQAKRAGEQVYTELMHLVKKNNLEKKVRIFPPQAAPIARIRGRWRYRLIVKTKSLEILVRILTYINDFPRRDGVQITCDVNPTRMT